MPGMQTCEQEIGQVEDDRPQAAQEVQGVR